MNIKLKNLRSAEEDLGKFLGNIVVTSELATSICGDEVNDAYLEYVIQLNSKVRRASDSEFVRTAITQATGHIVVKRSGVGAINSTQLLSILMVTKYTVTNNTTSYLFPFRSSTLGRPMRHQMAPAWTCLRQPRWRRKEYSPTSRTSKRR